MNISVGQKTSDRMGIVSLMDIKHTGQETWAHHFLFGADMKVLLYHTHMMAGWDDKAVAAYKYLCISKSTIFWPMAFKYNQGN